MQVLNRKHLGAWPPGSVYIGRGTPFGNPYVIGEHGDRDAVCDQYADRMAYRIERGDPVILTALLGLNEDSPLVCSCAPLRCHGNEIEAAWRRLQKTGLPARKRSMTYAGIGSRKTPADQMDRMRRAARRLAAMGYTLRSGAADGADSAFELGAGEKKEIYLPWPGFNGSTSSFVSPTREAMEVAMAVHPAWSRLSPAVQKLMARNSHQILGPDLLTPSDFVVCWTPDGAETEMERSAATGGTGQAIALASRWGIPVFNFARQDAGERLLRFVEDAKRPGMANERHGSIFDARVEALVNPVNTEGVMGKGLALEFKKRFPDAYESYNLACRRGDLVPGRLHNYRLPDGRHIIHFPTKTDWRSPSRIEYIKAGLPALVDLVRKSAIKSIAIPALGCGLGGLAWDVVKPMIEEAFVGLAHVEVQLFGPRDVG